MKITTKQLCLIAVFTALVFAVTRFIQIPIPLGYFNIGNTVIILSCLLLPSPSGIFIGCIGSALADLTSYPVYTLPTAVIKALFPLVFYLLIKTKKPVVSNPVFAAGIATLIPLFGYTATGCVLYGFYTGLAQFPGLLLEFIANLILIAVLYKPISGLSKYIH